MDDKIVKDVTLIPHFILLDIRRELNNLRNCE